MRVLSTYVTCPKCEGAGSSSNFSRTGGPFRFFESIESKRRILLYFMMSLSLISKYAYTVSRETTLAMRVSEAFIRLPSSTSRRLT